MGSRCPTWHPGEVPPVEVIGAGLNKCHPTHPATPGSWSSEATLGVDVIAPLGARAPRLPTVGPRHKKGAHHPRNGWDRSKGLHWNWVLALWERPSTVQLAPAFLWTLLSSVHPGSGREHPDCFSDKDLPKSTGQSNALRHHPGKSVSLFSPFPCRLWDPGFCRISLCKTDEETDLPWMQRGDARGEVSGSAASSLV